MCYDPSNLQLRLRCLSLHWFIAISFRLQVLVGRDGCKMRVVQKSMKKIVLVNVCMHKMVLISVNKPIELFSNFHDGGQVKMSCFSRNN